MIDFLFLLAQVAPNLGAGPDGQPHTGLFGYDWGEVIAAVVGTGVTAWGGWWAYRKSQLATHDTQQFKFYEQMLAECNALRAECTTLRLELGKCQRELDDLRSKLEFFEDNKLASQARAMMALVANDLDNPMWIHVIGDNKWYLNDAYCAMFSVERKNFWTPVNLFARFRPEEVLEYIAHDLHVVEAGVPLTFEENVRTRIMDPNCEDFCKLWFRKSPITIGETKYVLGSLVEKPKTFGVD